MTPQRLEIFREVARAQDHPSAEQVYKRVKPKMPNISLDTVYRTLATFEQCGLLSKLIVFEDHTRFDPNTSAHHHMVCTECRKVYDFSWPVFEKLELPRRARGWGIINDRQVQLMGLCKECLNRRERKDK